MEATALAASGLMPTRQLDKAELCGAVQQAVAGLNDRQRMAVLLAKFEHFSYADIGAIMDMSPQAVKSLLSRAHGNLRQSLQPYLERGVQVSNGTRRSIERKSTITRPNTLSWSYADVARCPAPFRSAPTTRS